LLKDSEVDDWTSDGREFQRMAAATGNERQPADTRRCVGILVVGMMLMNADGGDQAGRQHEPADQGMAGPDHATLGTP